MATTAIPSTAATSMAGTLGAYTRSTKMTTSETMPMISVGTLRSSNCRTSTASLPKNVVPPLSTPSSL